MPEYIDRQKVEAGVLGLTIVDPAVMAYAEAVLSIVRNLPCVDSVPGASMTVHIPCRINERVWIIASRGGIRFTRPARVVRIEIDENMRTIIYTKGGFGPWKEKVFPDKPSADAALERRKS